MFEQASRLKLRFNATQGMLTVEDLWDLPLKTARTASDLNAIAKGLNKELKDTAEEDFVGNSQKPNELLQLKFDIVRHVITVRLAEQEEARLKAAKKEQKARLLEIIARKQDQALESTSLEDLQKMVADL